MLAYCVYRSSSLKARLLSEQFDGNESKIQKDGLITELGQTFQRKILLEVGFKKVFDRHL